jgi:hypothetical protein
MPKKTQREIRLTTCLAEGPLHDARHIRNGQETVLFCRHKQTVCQQAPLGMTVPGVIMGTTPGNGFPNLRIRKSGVYLFPQLGSVPAASLSSQCGRNAVRVRHWSNGRPMIR